MDTQLLVLSVSEKYFIEKSICEHNHIGDENLYTVKDDQIYYSVTPEEIGIACTNMHASFKIEEANLKVYVVVFDEKPDHDFDVCYYDNHYFVEKDIIDKFHLTPLKKKARVNGIIYYEISLDQIALIEGSSIYGVWQANYRKIVSNQ